jgi:FxsC-like protein
MNPTPRALDVYFLLSHVRTSVPDQWVHRFHQALELAVSARAAPTEGLRSGSLYYETIATAREQYETGDPPRARVVVPLYTREFLHDPPPEFVEYCEQARAGSRSPHLHPVFWDANPGGRDAPGLVQARSLGSGIADYDECGLAAMCRLNAFSRSYRKIVDRLADRIVMAAEQPNQRPSWVEAGPPPGSPPIPEAQFVVSVIAAQWQRWNPFGGADGALVDYTTAVARALMLLPVAVSYDAMDAEMLDSPGVLLIDLWALDVAALRPTIQRALQFPPPWVSVVVVAARRADDQHDTRREELITLACNLASRLVSPISTRDGFERRIEDVVQRTRRNYLRRQQANPRPPGQPSEETPDE